MKAITVVVALILCTAALCTAQDSPDAAYEFRTLIPSNGFELMPGKSKQWDYTPRYSTVLSLTAQATSGVDVSVFDLANPTVPICANPAVTSSTSTCVLRGGHRYGILLIDSRYGERAELGIFAGLLSRGKATNLTPNKITFVCYVLFRDGHENLYLRGAPRPALP
jgi:hypothetical protein